MSKDPFQLTAVTHLPDHQLRLINADGQTFEVDLGEPPPERPRDLAGVVLCIDNTPAISITANLGGRYDCEPFWMVKAQHADPQALC